MLRRTSCIQSLHIKSVGIGSIIEIGDSSFIQSSSRALALQREQELFFGNEGDFSKYRIFSDQIPYNPISTIPSIQFDNRTSPMIKVNNLKVIAVSASSIVHVGSSRCIQMETRIKHIRQLRDGERNDSL